MVEQGTRKRPPHPMLKEVSPWRGKVHKKAKLSRKRTPRVLNQTRRARAYRSCSGEWASVYQETSKYVPEGSQETGAICMYQLREWVSCGNVPRC